jgi:hypothetical protein
MASRSTAGGAMPVSACGRMALISDAKATRVPSSATYSGLTPMRSRTRYSASSRKSSMAMANMPLSLLTNEMPSRSYRRRMTSVSDAVLSYHTLAAQVGRQFDVVEDFTVLHNGDLAIVGHERLVPAAQVDDRQAHVANGHAALRLVPDAPVVWPAVGQAARHAIQRRVGQGAPLAVPVAKDAAHQLLPCR